MGMQAIGAGQSRHRWEKRHPLLAREERQLQAEAALIDKWRKHESHGTPETLLKAQRVHQGSLARMFMNGHLSIDQLAWAEEIRRVVERIGRDVAIGTISLETRVDNGFAGHRIGEESLGRVRSEVAYSRWRQELRKPAAVLAMILEDRSCRAVAAAFRMRDVTARAVLTRALDAWPDCYGWARDHVDEYVLIAVQRRLA